MKPTIGQWNGLVNIPASQTHAVLDEDPLSSVVLPGPHGSHDFAAVTFEKVPIAQAVHGYPAPTPNSRRRRKHEG